MPNPHGDVLFSCHFQSIVVYFSVSAQMALSQIKKVHNAIDRGNKVKVLHQKRRTNTSSDRVAATVKKDKKAKKPSGMMDAVALKSKIQKHISGKGIKEIIIQGIADTRGSELKNLKLGQDRATKLAKLVRAIPNRSPKQFDIKVEAAGKGKGSAKDNPSQRSCLVWVHAFV